MALWWSSTSDGGDRFGQRVGCAAEKGEKWTTFAAEMGAREGDEECLKRRVGLPLKASANGPANATDLGLRFVDWSAETFLATRPTFNFFLIKNNIINVIL